MAVPAAGRHAGTRGWPICGQEHPTTLRMLEGGRLLPRNLIWPWWPPRFQAGCTFPCESRQLPSRHLPSLLAASPPHFVGLYSPLFRRFLPCCRTEIIVYMPLSHPASPASRIQKPAANRRASSSPFSAAARTKASAKRAALAEQWEDESSSERLDDTGKVVPHISVAAARDVLTSMDYITTSMFSAFPERAGMHSTRIAEVLNFQKNLPPIVTRAHLHALISASSKVERDTASLLSSGALRKLRIVGRGNDVSGVSEVLISAQHLERLLRESSVPSPAVDAFLDVLRKSPKTVSLPSRSLVPSHAKELLRAGFLVSSSLFGAVKQSSPSSSVIAISSISRAASGSVAAVGGEAAFEQLGGVGSARRKTQAGPPSGVSPEYFLSIPNIGPYLRLLSAGRAHLLELLGRSKYHEAPLYLLRERWDGAVDSDSRISHAKRIRGEFSGILPAKTKKWRDLYGLSFDWALEECFGAGLVELFETHSVGLGIRALT